MKFLKKEMTEAIKLAAMKPFKDTIVSSSGKISEAFRETKKKKSSSTYES